MRVTNSLMSQGFLRNLSKTTNKVYKYQEQLSTLKEVNRPSDDPMSISRILDLENSIVQNEEYKKTMEDAIDWTNVQDSALSQATESMSRIKQLIQQAANGTLNASDRLATKAEIESEIASLVDSFNENFGGRYVFAGKNTTTAPFEIKRDEQGAFEEILYHGTPDQENAKLPREVARNIVVELNTDGKQLFNENGEENIGTFFNDVLTALDQDDPEALSGLLGEADNQLDNIIGMRTEIGAIFNRFESAKERNESEHLNLKTMLSNKQDVDLAEKFMEYQMESLAYQASLSMGTRILQTNILDYL